jgi:large subunit ribosomal protein L22
MTKEKEIVSATAKNIRISPSKIDKIICKIRGKKYKEALQILKYLPQKAGAVVWQTLYSAVSNATNNFELDKGKLIISEAYVNQGATTKRFACGSKGSPRKLEKKSSHITIRVTEI